VNNLCPGYMKTDLIINLLAKEGKHIEENWVKDIPMGRLSHPSELQGTIVWMASDASSYLNGSDIVSGNDEPSIQYSQILIKRRLLMEDIVVGEPFTYATVTKRPSTTRELSIK